MVRGNKIDKNGVQWMRRIVCRFGTEVHCRQDDAKLARWHVERYTVRLLRRRQAVPRAEKVVAKTGLLGRGDNSSERSRWRSIRVRTCQDRCVRIDAVWENRHKIVESDTTRIKWNARRWSLWTFGAIVKGKELRRQGIGTWVSRR